MLQKGVYHCYKVMTQETPSINVYSFRKLHHVNTLFVKQQHVNTTQVSVLIVTIETATY